MGYEDIILFKGMTESEISELLNSVIHQKKIFEKGDIVALAGSKCINLKIIIGGSVHTEMYGENDKVITLAKINAGQVIAIAFLFGTNNFMPVDVIADERTEVLVLPEESVMSMIQNNKRFLQSLLNQISNQTQFLSQKIRFLNFSTLREKVIFFIRQEEKKQKSDWIVVKKTQQQLAETFGVARPSLARVFKDMADEKIISFDGPKRMRLNLK